MLTYKESVSRVEALEFLAKHYGRFPDSLPTDRPSEHISHRMVGGWRWVGSLEGDIIFADCLQPCIEAAEFDAYVALIQVAV